MERLWIALPAVFFVVDPLGVLPLFIAMTANDSPAKARAMALKACITGAGLLAVFTLFGGVIFKIFGVSLPAFRVAGGLLLLMTAWDMLKAQPSQTKTSEAEALEGVKKDDIAIVPLAIPLLAGPGSIATVMVLMAQGDGFRTGVAVIVSIALTFLGAFLLLANSHLVKKVLQQTGIAIMQRVFGLILAAIAVQFVADGVSELVKGQP
jgi:multiple antibiotic resistance protein